jgi:hypothetical protein
LFAGFEAAVIVDIQIHNAAHSSCTVAGPSAERRRGLSGTGVETQREEASAIAKRFEDDRLRDRRHDRQWLRSVGAVLVVHHQQGEIAREPPTPRDVGEHAGLAAGEVTSGPTRVAVDRDAVRVFYPVKKAAVAARTGRFRAKSANTYCLMWENRGKSVAVIEGVVENAAAR